MTYPRINRQSSIKLILLLVTGLCLLVFSISGIAEQTADDDNNVMIKKLLEFHTKLAKQGNPESIAQLGIMYENGEGVPKDRNKAIKLYQLAVDKGYEPAQQLLANILDNKPNNSKGTSTLNTLRVPTPKKNTAKNNSDARKQEELRLKLEREKAAAEAARLELEQYRQEQIREQEKQQRLLNDVEEIQKAQEELARERAKAEAARRELEQLRKAQEEELRKQRELAKKRQEEKSKAQQEAQKEQSDTSENTTFSSDPCKTPAAKFMSSCN
jgi:hypothetical protein